MNPYRLFLAVVLIAALFAGVGILCGAEPPKPITITGPTEPVPAGKTVKLPIGGVTVQEFLAAVQSQKCHVKCYPPSADLDGGFDFLTAGVLLRFSAEKDGDYCVVISWHRPDKIEQVEAKVPVGNKRKPEPEPKPNPKPEPKPLPTEPVAIYLIYESGDLTPANAKVRDALPWKVAAESLGIKWLAFDDDSGEKQFPNATKRARDAGLPAVVLIDKAGMPEVLKVPETPEAMEKLVKEKGGAK